MQLVREGQRTDRPTSKALEAAETRLQLIQILQGLISFVLGGLYLWYLMWQV
jgi:hypothetical protein